MFYGRTALYDHYTQTLAYATNASSHGINKVAMWQLSSGGYVFVLVPGSNGVYGRRLPGHSYTPWKKLLSRRLCGNCYSISYLYSIYISSMSHLKSRTASIEAKLYVQPPEYMTLDILEFAL